MKIEDTKITVEVRSTRDLNYYLQSGWILTLAYVKHQSDTQEPRFIVSWQRDDTPVHPELLDEWELHEMERQRNR